MVDVYFDGARLIVVTETDDAGAQVSVEETRFTLCSGLAPPREAGGAQRQLGQRHSCNEDGAGRPRTMSTAVYLHGLASGRASPPGGPPAGDAPQASIECLAPGSHSALISDITATLFDRNVRPFRLAVRTLPPTDDMTFAHHALLANRRAGPARFADEEGFAGDGTHVAPVPRSNFLDFAPPVSGSFDALSWVADKPSGAAEDVLYEPPALRLEFEAAEAWLGSRQMSEAEGEVRENNLIAGLRVAHARRTAKERCG